MNPMIFALALAVLPPAALAQSEALAGPAAPRPVISEIVTADPVRARSFPGVIEGENPAMLGFLTAGRLATVAVETGDRVARGDVLATLDQVTLEQDLAAARAAFEAAEAKATLAVQQYERVATLNERGVASAAVLDDTAAGRDAAVAQAASARASLTRAQDAARYGTLTAARDAIVLQVLAKVGTTVSSGIPVVELADPVGRDAVIDVPDAFAALLPPGAPFSLSRHGQDSPPVKAVLSVVEPV